MLSNIEIGERIKTRRISLGMTMEDVANRIGVTKSTVQRYETGKISRIKLPVIESIASALGVNPDWLIGNSETPEPAENHDHDIKAALWGGDKDLSQEDIDALWDDVRAYAEFKTQQRKKNQWKN